MLDLGLPVMDGYELAQRLRERGTEKRERRSAPAAGFAEHMAKPVDLRNLVRALDPR